VGGAQGAKGPPGEKKGRAQPCENGKKGPQRVFPPTRVWFKKGEVPNR